MKTINILRPTDDMPSDWILGYSAIDDFSIATNPITGESVYIAMLKAYIKAKEK